MENVDSFFKKIQNNDIKAIEEAIKQNKDVLQLMYPESQQTIFNLACKDDKIKAETLEILLDESTDYKIQQLFNIVSYSGNYEKLQLLIKRTNIEENEKRSVEITPQILCRTLKHFNTEEDNPINYEKCSDIILDKLESQKNHRININERDYIGYTALHYSLRYWDNKKSLRLLKLGASLACRSKYGNMAIEFIETEFLEEYLNSCLKFSEENKSANPIETKRNKFQIEINYQNLIPPRENNVKFQLETETIEYLSKTPEFHSLLKHPVVESFLLMKWHRIRLLFYSNLIFYLFFLISLNFYILNYYSKSSSVRPNVSNKIHSIIFNLSFWVLVFRELFQMIISPELYFRNYNNLVKIILIFVGGIILFVDSSDHNRRILSSIVILLGAYEFLIMVGQNPYFSTYVVMFQTVTKNFVKLLFLYSGLIIAFASSFHIIFATVDEKRKTNNQTEIITTKNLVKSGKVFDNPLESIFQTIFMLTREFNSDYFNFILYPIISRIIVCFFIFMISITLLNLLNGLAVSDVQKIQNNPKIIKYVVLAQHVFYVETMLSSKLFRKFENNLFKFLSPIVKNIWIFTTSKTSLYIFPNFYGKVSVHKEQKLKKFTSFPWYVFNWYYLNNVFVDSETIRKSFTLAKANANRI